ncbi:MAG TPA: hypothetical protein VJ914_36520 [Pseudonocardiaceae bacterium]|nr:hypothetical protein [Pseudonocardiaceae bacterium]
MNGISQDRAINPAPAAAEVARDGARPARRVVRLDAEYLSAGTRRKPAPDAIEPEEEQLIVLPARSGPWIARFVRWLFS